MEEETEEKKEHKESTGVGKAALICGICGLLTGSCVLTAGVIFCIAGIVLGIIDLCANKGKSKTAAKVGIVCAIFGFPVVLVSPFNTSSTGTNTQYTSDSVSDVSVNTGSEDLIRVSDVSTSTESESRVENDVETNDYFYVGDTFTVGNIEITFDGFDSDFTDYNEYHAPNDGYKYVKADFTYRNAGETNTVYVSIYDFNCYADDENMEEAYLSDDSFINVNLSPNRTKSFSVYFSVPVGAESIELEYVQQKVFTSDEIYILKGE